jgi:hypothetical protein
VSVLQNNSVNFCVALNFTVFQYRSSGASIVVGNYTAASNTTLEANLLIFKTNGGKAIKSAAIEAAAPLASATAPQDYPQSSILIILTTSDSTSTSHNRFRAWGNFLCIYPFGFNSGTLLPYIFFHQPEGKGSQKD